MSVFTQSIYIGAQPGEANQKFNAVVDTGAINTSLPASVLDGLGVARTRRERFLTASGETEELDMGLARIRIDDREAWTWVLFAEEESPVNLGRLSLNNLLLEVAPQGGKLVQMVLYR